MAVEYQGTQHFEVIEHWGGGEGLRERQRLDAKKQRKCAENGVALVTVHPDSSAVELVALIEKLSCASDDRDDRWRVHVVGTPPQMESQGPDS